MQSLFSRCGALVILLASVAWGQPVTVDILRTGGIVETSYYNEDQTIDLSPLTDPDSVTLIRAYSTNPDSSADIGPLVLGGTRTVAGTLDVLIGRAGAIDPFAINPLPPAATNWSGIIVEPDLVHKVRLSGAILGDVNGPITVGEIVRLQCGGDIVSGVQVHNTGMSLGRVVARSLAHEASIIAHHGDIGTLQFTSASESLSIGGDIEALEGSIDAILANGWIGNDAAIVPQVLARDGILTLEAVVVGVGSAIRANAFDGTGPLRRVQVLWNRGVIAGHDVEVDPLSATGLTIAALNGDLDIYGDVFQNITVTNAEAIYELPPGRVRIAGNLHASITCQTGLGEVRVDGMIERHVGSPPIRIALDEAGTYSPVFSLRLGHVVDTPGDSAYDVQVSATVIGNLHAASFTGDLTAEFIDGEVLGSAGGRIVIGPQFGVPGGLDIHGDFGAPSSPAGFDFLSLNGYLDVRIGGQAYGTIELDATRGQPGHIIIGANALDPTPPSGGWNCTVQRTIAPGNLIQISTSQSQPDHAPHYDRLSSDLGGGSIGSVPFHLHDLDCLPPNGPTTPVFLNSAFCHIPPSVPDAYEFQEIVLAFYGPVYADTSAPFPVRVRHVDSPGGTEYAAMMDVTFDQGQGGSLSRFITLHGDGSTLIPAGTYVIRPILDTDPQTGEPTFDALRCDGLLTADEVLVGEDFSYTFVLVSDCNLNGQEDTEEIAQNLMLDVWPMNGIIDSCEPDACVLDYNDDGNVDQDDLDCLTCLVAGGPCPHCHPHANPDFNRDGNVDQQDINDLANAIASGCP